MRYDLTADILERAIKRALEPIGSAIIVEDATSIPDDFDGYLVQVRHTSNTVLTNDGKLPVLATYDAEIVRRIYGDGILARQTDSGAIMTLTLSALQEFVDAELEEGLVLPLIHIALSSEEIETSEADAHLFSSTFEVTCHPLLVED